MMKCKADCLFNIGGKCTRQSKKDMTVIGKWKNDFKGFISELSMPEDDFYGIMQYIDEVPNEPKWIPVNERLPDKNGRYLVTVKQGYITFGVWVGVAENWTKVIAWMPLPEPYKAESEGTE